MHTSIVALRRVGCTSPGRRQGQAGLVNRARLYWRPVAAPHRRPSATHGMARGEAPAIAYAAAAGRYGGGTGKGGPGLAGVAGVGRAQHFPWEAGRCRQPPISVKQGQAGRGGGTAGASRRSFLLYSFGRNVWRGGL